MVCQRTLHTGLYLQVQTRTETERSSKYSCSFSLRELFGTGKKCFLLFLLFHSNKRENFQGILSSGGGNEGDGGCLSTSILAYDQHQNRQMTPGKRSREGSFEGEAPLDQERKRERREFHKRSHPLFSTPPPLGEILFAGPSPSTASLDADFFFREQAICDLLLGPETNVARQTDRRTDRQKGRRTGGRIHTQNRFNKFSKGISAHKIFASYT